MQQPTLVIITGHPGSGKSSIGKQLAGQYNVPCRSKDTLKEYMFDSLGAKDKTWSRRLSGDVLFERWTSRVTTGERHEGHVEAISLEQIKQDLAEPYPPLQLDGELIRLDTTDFSKLQLPALHLS